VLAASPFERSTGYFSALRDKSIGLIVLFLVVERFT